MEKEWLIEAQEVAQQFCIRAGCTVSAVNGVSFGIHPGEVFGLVGESGCGKSTLARMLAGIYRPTGGQILFDGVPVSGAGTVKEQKKKMQREVQLVFQDSAAALNPRMNVEQLVLEPLRIHRVCDRQSARERLLELLEDVGLDDTCLGKRPEELSGGQRQRVAIARSLMLKPRLILADEPIAAMDLSIQAQIIMLFRRLQREQGFSMLLIAHDLAVVRLISNRVGVMLQGKLVELAPVEELFEHPMHPYTKSLLSAIHVPDPVYERQKKFLDYDRRTPLGTQLREQSDGHYLLV